MPTDFTPGPSPMAEDIMMEMTRPTIGHRSKEYATLHEEVLSRFKRLFDWEGYHVYLVTASATGLMEGAIRNCVHNTVMHTTCGAFSERWAEVSQLNGKKVLQVEAPWGQAVKPEMVGAAIKKDLPEAVTFTSCETSTGILNPVKELCESVRQAAPETLIMVDSVSSMGGVPLEMKKWGIDVLFFGLQKCFSLPAGLSIVAISPRAYEKSLLVENRGYYFNFEEFEQYNIKNNTPATPPLPTIYALRRILEIMEKEGLESRYRKHNDMLKLMQKWCAENSFEFFSEKGYQSPTVSAIKIRPDLEVASLVKAMKEKGFILPEGYGKLKSETFRIGHMGNHTVKTLDNLLKAINEVAGPYKVVQKKALANVAD